MAKTTLKDLRDLRLEIARRGLNDVLSLPIPLLVEEASLPPKAEVLLLGMHTIEYAETLEELTSAKAQALLRKELGAAGLGR